MSASVSPWFRRLIASRFWWSVSLNGRPIFCPRATARARPSPVRARIRSRSNSARPPSTVNIKRPCDVVVSAHASPSERKPAFLPVIAASVFNRSRVDRASRSSRVTIHVAGIELVEQAAKLRPVGLTSARHFAEHLSRPLFPQRRYLSGRALAVRRYQRIAVNHRFILHQNSAPKKRNRFNDLILCEILDFAQSRWVPGRLDCGLVDLV